MTFRAFRHPVVVLGKRPVSPDERRDLSRTLEEYRSGDLAKDGKPKNRTEVLLNFLRDYPASPYAICLWSEVAAVAESEGDFSRALEAWRHAWEFARTITYGEDNLSEAAVILRQYARFLTRIGHKDALESLLNQVKSRPAHAASVPALRQAQAAQKYWLHYPDFTSSCGLIAYNTLAAQTGDRKVPMPEGPVRGNRALNKKSDNAGLVTRGLSANDLTARISSAGGRWHWIKRVSGDVIPVPSVVHWRFDSHSGHYSAAMEGLSDSTRIVDPALGVMQPISNAILNRQITSCFLVPVSSELPNGFVIASAKDLTGMYGRTVGCPDGTDDEGCDSPDEECGGMAVAAFTKFLPGLVVQDRPLSYRPLFGPWIDLKLQYRQVELHDEASHWKSSHLGPNWNHPLMSFVRSESDLVLPTPTDRMRLYSGGSYFRYGSAAEGYAGRYSERPKLTYLGATSPGYRVTFADGSVQDFTTPDSVLSPRQYYLTAIRDPQGNQLTIQYDSQLRIEKLTDATGKDTHFGYSGTDSKIRTITDHAGRVATIEYDTEGRVSSIRDTIGLVSTFLYDDDNGNSDRIRQFTTPYGTTTVAYEGSPSLENFNENWAVTVSDPQLNARRIERFYHDGFTPFLAEERPPATISGTPFRAPNASEHFHVTLEWDKQQWGQYLTVKAGDPTADRKQFAQYTLWLMRTERSIDYTTYSATVPVPVAMRRPGESATWFRYPGQTFEGQESGSVVGTSALPITVARKVENEAGNGTWTITQHTWEPSGLPGQYTDELGRLRRTTYTPVTNKRLSEDVQVAPNTWVSLRTFAYPDADPASRLPERVTDLSGLVTRFHYNSVGQVDRVTRSKGGQEEAVRYVFSEEPTQPAPAWSGTTRGFLRRIEKTDPTNAALWVVTDAYTYDDKQRIRTHTDAGGYVRTFDYDDFDRVTIISHPDGVIGGAPEPTTERFVYKWLDLEATKDRAGRWTRTLHNSIRQPEARIEPDGRKTQYAWCRCGSLRQLIDPLGRVTEWKRDLLGRVTEKVLPDGLTRTTYSYQPLSGRLATMTQPNDQPGTTVTYRYFVDGRRALEDYTSPSTADVSYRYTTDPNGATLDPLGRLTFVTDGIGTHSLSYVPLTAGLPGAGKLHSTNGPLIADTLRNSYDWQDRAATLELLDDAPSPAVLRSESTTWDSLGRRQAVSNALGTFTHNYTTALPRLDSITRPNSFASTFTHWPNAERGEKARKLREIRHMVPFSGPTVLPQFRHTYNYDTAGRITDWSRQTLLHGSRFTTYAYNLADELVQAEDRNGGTLVARETWGLDTGGNWLSRTRENADGNLIETRGLDSAGLNKVMRIGGAGSTVIEGTVNEFATVTVNGQPASLRSDPVASNYRFRREVAVTPGSNTVQISATDPQGQSTTQKWQFTVPAAQRQFTYDNGRNDGNGNTTADGLRSYTWDAKNRLKSVTVLATGQTWSWDYDYRDRRVREYKNSVLEKVFIWSGNEIVQERSSSPAITNAITRTHCFGGFVDGTAPAVGTKYHILTDHLGHVREVLTPTGTLAARYDYSPYQGPVKLPLINENPPVHQVTPTFLTIGRYYHHTGTGLELALYRAYDPELGRWISRDPLPKAELREGPNVYGFVRNEPIEYGDELGLKKCGALVQRPLDYDIPKPAQVFAMCVFAWHELYQGVDGSRRSYGGDKNYDPNDWFTSIIPVEIPESMSCEEFNKCVLNYFDKVLDLAKRNSFFNNCQNGAREALTACGATNLGGLW